MAPWAPWLRLCQEICSIATNTLCHVEMFKGFIATLLCSKYTGENIQTLLREN